jgi:integrase
MPSFWRARDERLGREVAIKGMIRVPRQKTDEESVIPISAMCRAALEECSRLGAYVFTTAESKPFSVSTINRAFARAKKLAGIERRWR